jgi:hypothetical protein
MRRTRPPGRPLAPLVAMAFGVATMLPATARAQDLSPSTFPVGTESLRYLLKRAELEAVSDPGRLADDPSHSILIVLGNLGWLETQLPGGIQSFVERGGALLAASDLRTGRALGELSGVRVDGVRRVEYLNHPGDCNQGQSDRPYVVALSAALPDGIDNPFEGLRVATNIPSYLRQGRLPAGVAVLARFPLRVATLSGLPRSTDRSEVFNFDPGVLGLLFAVGGVRGDGRLLVLADHSVFINEMMLEDTCDNLTFTVKSLEWLKDEGRRTKAMLVEDGHVYANFNVRLRRLPPLPPLKVLEEMFNHRDEIAAEAEKRLLRAEHDGALDTAALNALGRPRVEALARLRRYFWWALGVGLAAAALYRLSYTGRYLPDAGLPLPGAAVAGQRATGTAAEQRPRAQLEAGNLWESARDLARQRLGGPRVEPGQAPPRPEVVGGGRWQRRAARRRLERLRAVAYGPAPGRVPPGRWGKFLDDLAAFDRDVADGTVKLPAA